MVLKLFLTFKELYNLFHPSSFLCSDMDLAKHTGIHFSFTVTVQDLLVLIHYRRNVYFSKLLMLVFKMRRKSKRERRQKTKKRDLKLKISKIGLNPQDVKFDDSINSLKSNYPRHQLN